MKKFPKLTSAFLLLLAALTLCVSADGAYSSKDDPLVSLSYVNDVLGPEIMAQVMARVEKEYIKLSDISKASAGRARSAQKIRWRSGCASDVSSCSASARELRQ